MRNNVRNNVHNNVRNNVQSVCVSTVRHCVNDAMMQLCYDLVMIMTGGQLGKCTVFEILRHPRTTLIPLPQQVLKCYLTHHQNMISLSQYEWCSGLTH